MRICIPIEFRPQGGGFYFLNAFIQHFAKNGWEILSDVEATYDVLFTNHWMVPRTEILRAIRFNPKVRVVQRVDGAAQDYGRGRESDERQKSVNLLADLTIFQSEYCRFSTRNKFSAIVNDGPVIYNPVDLELFSPLGRRRPFRKFESPIVCVTWSTNPMKGASSIYAVAAANPDLTFVLCGRYPDAPDLSNLVRLGILDHRDLAEVLRSCQVLLTFSRNEACPNHVLEGLASGLPILYEDSGAMSEVIGECGLSVTVDLFRGRYEEILSNLATLSARARNRAIDLFNPTKIFAEYENVIRRAVELPTRVPWFSRALIAWANMFIVHRQKYL